MEGKSNDHGKVVTPYLSRKVWSDIIFMPGKCAWVCATWTSWTSPRACQGSSGKGAQARQADSHRRVRRMERSTQVHMIQQLEEQAWVSQALNTHWYINHIYLSWAPWYLSIWRRLYSTEVLISLLIVEICFAFISSDRSSLVSTYIQLSAHKQCYANHSGSHL